MHYMSAILEQSSELRNTLETKEKDFYSFIETNIGDFIYHNFKYVLENINQFLGSSVLETHNNIKNFIKHDMLNLLTAVSEISAMDESYSYVNDIMESEVSNVFTGIGYGAQKAAYLIEGFYDDSDDQSD